jgi:hypothetical protein
MFTIHVVFTDHTMYTTERYFIDEWIDEFVWVTHIDRRAGDGIHYVVDGNTITVTVHPIVESDSEHFQWRWESE